MFKLDIQRFTVYPVHNNVFKINVLGRTTPESFVTIADCETFEVSIDGNVEEWTPMDTEGWMRRMKTGSSISINLAGKRNFGDAGQDYISETIMSTGNDSNSILEWTLPNGDKLTMPCVINLASPGGGDSTAVDSFEVDLMSDGKPTYSDNTNFSELTFTCVDATTAGCTKVTSVSPTLTGGNSYYYKVNGALPGYGESIVGKYWAAYTLGGDIPVVNGNNVALIEVTSGNLVVGGGIAPAVVT